MQALPQNQKKLVRALSTKVGRKKHGFFLIEGKKIIDEFLSQGSSNYEIVFGVFCDESYIQPNYDFDIYIDTGKTVSSIGSLVINNYGLLVVKIPDPDNTPLPGNSLLLDDIKDPGNLGTIIRSADWFGYTNIICSPESVEFYNPKVIMASMGSIFRMNLIVADLAEYIESTKITVYAADLEGEDLHKMQSNSEDHALLLGNESHGINPELLSSDIHKITIPKYGQAESLSVGIAASICMYHISNS